MLKFSLFFIQLDFKALSMQCNKKDPCWIFLKLNKAQPSLFTIFNGNIFMASPIGNQGHCGT